MHTIQQILQSDSGFYVLQQGGCMRVSSWLPAVSHAVAEDTHIGLN